MTSIKKIIVIGGGITGLWQAYALSKRGYDVTLLERGNTSFNKAASAVAGAMLAPWCEGEAAEPAIAQMGIDSIKLWQEAYPDVVQHGTLVVTQPRDRNELKRFASMTSGFETIDETAITALEPALEGRYRTALFYKDEAHMQPIEAMNHIIGLLLQNDVEIIWGFQGNTLPAHDFLIDCRGMGAKDDLKSLRGVRGELLVIKSEEISLSRPVRLLHPRFPLYVVPWSGNRFMVGATVLESQETGAVTVRSALELLGMVYALHPAFGEAEILSFRANVRPAFPDNIPKIILRQKNKLYVNGIYRHGFLNAPALAEMVANYLETGQHPGNEYKDVFVEDNAQW